MRSPSPRLRVPAVTFPAFRQIAAVLLGTLLLGCSLFGLDNDELDRLRDQRRAWEKLSIRNYDQVFEVNCFCDPDSLRPVLISVRAGQTVSITRVATGEAVAANQWGTYPNIDELFARLESYFKQDDTVAAATYDATYHFPVEVTGSTKGAVDSGIGYRISGFMRQE